MSSSATAETHALIATLSLSDIDDVRGRRKGKARDGSPQTDEELAFQLYAEELSGFLACSRDAILARSIDRAVEEDRDILRTYAAAEAQDARDREMAYELAGMAKPALPSFTNADDVVPLDRAVKENRDILRAYTAVEAPDARDRGRTHISTGMAKPALPSFTSDIDELDAKLQRLLKLLSSSDDSPVRSPPRASAQASSSRVQLPSMVIPSPSRMQFPSRTILSLPPKPAPSKPAQKCIICTDPIRGAEIRAPCGHHYDASCLADLFRSATVDESLYPPRCCQQAFVLQDVRRHIGETVALTFETKALEFETANRVYCHRPTCSDFLGAAVSFPYPRFCMRCQLHTCAQCKQADHPSRPCDKAQDQEVLALAAQEGWKRCPGCKHLVELSIGCYHMICRCRKEFCYLCVADWKTCSCPLWEERRLLDVAAVRVERQVPQGAAAPPQATFQNMVRRVAEELRTNQDCQHKSWGYRLDGGRCESCNTNIACFLLQCAGCQMLQCVRCNHNR